MKTATLFERGEELGMLRGQVGALADGIGSTLVVRGPPGVGKTSLLGEAGAEARSRGIRVLSARSSPHEHDYSFAVVRQLFDPIVMSAEDDDRDRHFSGAARSARTLFEPDTDEGGQLLTGLPPYAVLHGLFWLLAGIAHSGPVLMIVDDAHWSDAASGGFLSFLVRRLEGLPVALLLAQRSADGTAERWLAELEDDPGVEVITPRPLSAQAITAITEADFPGPGDPELGQACRLASGGNPFYVRAALDELVRQNVPARQRPARLRGLGPETVLRSVLVRLARSPAGTVELAHAIAVLGDGTRLADAATLAGASPAHARILTDGLTALGILVADGGSVGFAHPIVRNALYLDLTAGARERLHGRAAALFAAAQAPPAQIVIHLLRSPPGQPGAAEMLSVAAAAALAQGAPELAVSYLRRALEEDLGEDTRAGLLVQLGVAEVQAGGGDAARHLAAGLRGARDAPLRVRAGLELAHVLAASDRAAEGIAVLAELGDELSSSDPQLAGRIFSELVSLGDLVDRTLVPARARRLAPADGPAGLTHRAVELTASARSAAEAGRLAQRALADGQLLARGDAVFAFACSMLIYAEAFAPAERYLDLALDGAVILGSAPGFVGASGQRALLNVRRGRLVDAEADARAALDVSRLHDWKLWPTHTLTMVIEALLARGYAREAAGELADVLEFGNPPPGNQGALLLEARGRLRLELGEHEAAVADLLEAGRRLESWGLHNPTVAAWRSHAALGLAALGEPRRARELAADEVALARRWGTPRALGVALRAQALTFHDERTGPLLREACGILARSDAPAEHARALTDLGAALRRANQRTEAREPLRAALVIAHATGATSLAHRAHTELTATGARPRLPMRTGVDALTPSERRIAQMAAAGASNMTIAQALFVTIKTVEMHLTSTYRKLDIRSRAQLASVIGDGAAGDTAGTDGEGGIRTPERGNPRYAISSRARSATPAPLQEPPDSLARPPSIGRIG